MFIGGEPGVPSGIGQLGNAGRNLRSAETAMQAAGLEDNTDDLVALTAPASDTWISRTDGIDKVFQRDPYHVNYVNAALGDLKANAVFVAELHEMRIGEMSVPYTLGHFSLLGLKQVLILFEAIILIALLVIGRKSLKQLAIVLTVFLGMYAITLALASMRVVNLPSQFTHFMIALSIVIVSLYTLLGKKKNLYPWLAGGFGFFYGAGYAEGLAGLQSDGGNNLYPVLAYMVGIAVALTLIAGLLYLLLHFTLKAKSLIPRISKVILPFTIVWLIVKLFL